MGIGCSLHSKFNIVTVADFASGVKPFPESPVIVSSLRKLGDRKSSNKLQTEAGVFESLYPLEKKEEARLKPITYQSTFQAVDPGEIGEQPQLEDAEEEVAQIDTQEAFKNEGGKRYKVVTTTYLGRDGGVLFKKSSKHLL